MNLDKKFIWGLSILIILIFRVANSEVDDDVKDALVQFMGKLTSGNAPRVQNWGWNASSDPCRDKWVGADCGTSSDSVRRIILDGVNLAGSLDFSSLCTVKSLVYLSLLDNEIGGNLEEAISNCKRLTHLFLGGNQISGSLPDSLSQLSNLKRFNISNNNFSGKLPDMARISGLLTFLVENNQLNGTLPELDFSNLEEYNVSNNNFSGPVPDTGNNFGVDSVLGNPELCGKPLPNACPSPPPSAKKSKNSSADRFLIFSGYIFLGLILLLLVAWKVIGRNKSKKTKTGEGNVPKQVAQDSKRNKSTSSTSSAVKSSGTRSEYSVTSGDSGMNTTSLMVLTSPVVNGLKFEDLLRAPAELLGRGKYGSLYKVSLENGVVLAVKRLKDWHISNEEFKRRMQKVDQAKHPNVLSPVAYYCSKQEKLLVYPYQPDGSLFKLLHGMYLARIHEIKILVQIDCL